jgi:hypothetical protein
VTVRGQRKTLIPLKPWPREEVPRKLESDFHLVPIDCHMEANFGPSLELKYFINRHFQAIKEPEFFCP